MAALDSFDAAVGAGAAAAPCSPPPPPLCLRMESSAAFFNAARSAASPFNRSSTLPEVRTNWPLSSMATELPAPSCMLRPHATG